MYTVSTSIKTIATTTELLKAMEIAEETAKTRKYVEVAQVISVTPWRAESVKVFYRA